MITEEQRVGEIAAISIDAVRVFEKSGIDYCCGGKQRLDEACRELGLDVAAVQEELQKATEGRSPEAKDWNKESLTSLIQHIVSKHHEFLKLEMPRLSQRLKRVLNAHGAKDPERLAELSQVYSELWAEMDHHMHKEEAMLFPTIERYEATIAANQPPLPLPFGTFNNPVAVMEQEHESAGNAVERIKELTNNYQPPEYACATYRALYDGFRELESDLHEHIHLENNILFPRAVELERSHR